MNFPRLQWSCAKIIWGRPLELKLHTSANFALPRLAAPTAREVANLESALERVLGATQGLFVCLGCGFFVVLEGETKFVDTPGGRLRLQLQLLELLPSFRPPR